MPKILMIEDDIHLREDTLELLQNHGFETIEADSGLQGLHKAKLDRPDVIICDINLPELNGYGVLTALRSEALTALIPVIFLSAKALHHEVRQGMNLGADDYLAKPFKFLDLLAVLQIQLHKQHPVQQLQRNVAALEASHQAQDEFLNLVSTQIRKPVSNILMAAKMLEDPNNQIRLLHYLQLIQTECHRELALMDYLLEIQQIKLNQSVARVETIRFQNWLPIVTEPYRVRSRQRQQRLQVNIPPYIPALSAKVSLLQRILEELLLNACKFTPPKGQIVLEVQRSIAPSNAATSTIFLLSNEGDIPQTSLTSLFQEFYRVPGGDTQQQGGNGLGLAIVQQLVTRLGGAIEISVADGWVHTSVQIPLAVAVELPLELPKS